jgi:hypothetical protein
MSISRSPPREVETRDGAESMIGALKSSPFDANSALEKLASQPLMPKALYVLAAQPPFSLNIDKRSKNGVFSRHRLSRFVQTGLAPVLDNSPMGSRPRAFARR